MIKPILITPGEPAGIGPDCVLTLLQKKQPIPIVIIADPDLLYTRAKQLNLPLTLHPYTPNQPIKILPPSHSYILPIKLKDISHPGLLNKNNSHYVLETLDTALHLALDNITTAIVTGPVNKHIINQAGIEFTGHTDYFAEKTNTKNYVMLLTAGKLRVALATTHIPLNLVSDKITTPDLISTLTIFSAHLKKYFNIENPHILISGLNPHAGENGSLGTEEIDIINPAIEHCKKRGLNLTGPLSADTLFIPKNIENSDGILVMYHDQGLPVLKSMGFGNAVNITLGLPFIRTSVDHGTALELAGTGLADPNSLQAALDQAIEMVTHG